MKFLQFEIKNFKGIEHCIVKLSPQGANIFTLIGLNESGKTSILEAISLFNANRKEDDDISKNLLTTLTSQNPLDYIPKHLQSNFTNKISIEATLELDNNLKINLINTMRKYGYLCDNVNEIDNTMTISRKFSFKDSILQEEELDTRYIGLSYNAKKIKSKKTKKYSLFCDDSIKELDNEIYKILKNNIPRILYFPTFIFNHPKKIYIDNSENDIDKMYSEIFSNVAASLKNPLCLKKHIIDRMEYPDKINLLNQSLDEMAAEITGRVLGEWKNVFKRTLDNSEIIITSGQDDKGKYLELKLKQKTSRFNITERSIGFRWFFTFLLLTFYKSKINNDKQTPIIFLLDEPASNLHASAQKQLLDSFPKIVDRVPGN
ncbi:MAG: AAA family ATPase [Candidatus Arsenophonus phytopathogenicus]